MHDTAEYTDEKEIIDQKAIELAEDFSYDGYQVVRRELFAHLREPAVVIRRDTRIVREWLSENVRKMIKMHFVGVWQNQISVKAEK